MQGRAGSRPPARGAQGASVRGGRAARGTQKGMDARGRRAGSRGPTEGTPGRRAASTSAPRVAPPPPASLGRRSSRGKAGRGQRGRRAGVPRRGRRWAREPCWGRRGTGGPFQEKVRQGTCRERRWAGGDRARGESGLRDPSRGEGGLGTPAREEGGLEDPHLEEGGPRDSPEEKVD